MIIVIIQCLPPCYAAHFIYAASKPGLINPMFCITTLLFLDENFLSELLPLLVLI